MFIHMVITLKAGHLATQLIAYRGEWATMGQFLLYNVSNFFDTIVTLVNACSQRLISWRRYLVAKILKINKEKRQKIQNAKSKF